MKKIVVFQFTVFDESIKELAKEIASEFEGVTKVVEVEGGEGQLEVTGEFSPSELTKELKKIDDSVETIKIVPVGVNEPEVKTQQQDEGKLPSNIHKPSWPSDVASSSNSSGVPAYGYLDKAIYAAKQAKDMGVGAAGKAIGLGAGAAGKAIDLGVEYFREKNKEKEAEAKLGRKPIVGKKENWLQPPKANVGRVTGVFEALVKNEEVKGERWRKIGEEMKLKKIREEKERRKQAEEMEQRKIRWEKEEMRKQAEKMEQRKIREKEEERRKQTEEMKRRKMRLEEEKEKMRKKELAIKKEEEKLKIWREKKMRDQGGTTWTGSTGSWWGNLSTQQTGQPSTSMSQRTGETSTWMSQRTGETSTWMPSGTGETSTASQRRKEESKGVDKKGKNRN